MSKEKDLSIAQRVRALKVGKHFIVPTASARQAALRVGKSLRDAGVIDFRVVTVPDGTGFKIAAI
jgi:hypothetical protein